MGSDERMEILLAIGNLQGTLTQLDERHTERCADLKESIAQLGTRISSMTDNGLPMCRLHSVRMDAIERTLDLRAVKPVTRQDTLIAKWGKKAYIAGPAGLVAGIIIIALLVWGLVKLAEMRQEQHETKSGRIAEHVSQ